jgi:hypothetical protein
MGRPGKFFRGKGFFIESKVYTSKAFGSLSKNAIKVLMALYEVRQIERKKDKKSVEQVSIVNNGKLKVSYTRFETRFKIPRSSIPRAIDQLLARGFIEITHRGGAFQHDPSTYKLIQEYLSWQPGQIIRTREKDVIKRGYQNSTRSRTPRFSRAS